MKRRILLVICLLVWSFQLIHSQENRIKNLEGKLDSLYQKGLSELYEPIDLSFSSISILDFVRALGKSSGLNITIDPNIKLSLSVNFEQEKPKNILLYLCKTYFLEFDLTGTIISLQPYKKPPPKLEPKVAKSLKISYEREGDRLSMDLKKDSLDNVLKRITQLSGKNVVFSPEVQGRKVSVYLENEDFESALIKLAYANNLEFLNSEGSYFIYHKTPSQNTDQRNPTFNEKNSSENKKNTINTNLTIASHRDTTSNVSFLNVEGVDIPIKEIIQNVSDHIGNDYFIYSDVEGSLSLHLRNITYEDLLEFLFLGTEYTFKNEQGIYLIGKRNLEQIRAHEVVRVNHRSVENLLELIPAELQRDVEVRVFMDLNSVIVSGSKPKIEELKMFMSEIDQRVPMLYLELLIIDFRRGRSVNTGVTAGIADTSVRTQGTILPGVDMTFSSGSINNFLSFLSDKGVVNLGQVTPNFYMGIQALEDQDRVDIRSTPKLSTLNGQTANLSIGETVFYRITQTDIIGTQNPQTVVTEQFKEASADMNIQMTPFISGDENVTITIDVELSNFQGTPISNAPPNRFTRAFSSEIRVQNNDLIVLGGLEQNTRASGGQGLPGMSRVPFFKWLFGKRSKSKSTSQLVVFIKPTIVY